MSQLNVADGIQSHRKHLVNGTLSSMVELS